MQVSKQTADQIRALHKSDMWIDEANFALKHICPYLSALDEGCRVLEVGSGAGVLLNELSRIYGKLKVTGIEPLGDGFSSLTQYHEKLIGPDLDLFSGGFEDFSDERKFDFIFLVNVFEHLQDWRRFLKFVKANLGEGGTCLILCPNYGFPFEPHFSIPIIVNKRLTSAVFRSYIERCERENDCLGLWSSLNFVRWSQVNTECRRLKLAVQYRTEITKEFVDRLNEDAAFSQRQSLLRPMVAAAKKLGLLSLLGLPALKRINPYMKLEVTINDDRAAA